MYCIGFAAIKGELSLSRNTRDGYKWLNRSVEPANAQYPHALHELDLFYENGLGSTVFADANYSIHLYHEAAMLGYAPSAYRLVATRASLPKAEYALGYFTELGIDIAQDLSLTLHWYRTAAEHGDMKAIVRLKQQELQVM
ncbi:hypothetical protein G6F46_010548 [Rhizopus delemar]|uniref:Sel1 repeat family protein n=2 Tax=Rhizopus TaxID=4842 RepID=A0A9P6YUX2_9FUNG|nr:hypothetical protein G6F55_004201 [Rhizopus delemar]KAG1538676.1 hypothetical protein G6F51_009621 [Rhizopus arrhizus]KAG1491292.1 hypothetical protein G6F54_010123 [Rhizopus delemar]KAG1505000.1 hypothetical protein G6F53_010275 [Rhizopus delemar]KAG1520492.1 hypothetical protein G6F52_007609 [Rhizopus delemar]